MISYRARRYLEPVPCKSGGGCLLQQRLAPASLPFPLSLSPDLIGALLCSCSCPTRTQPRNLNPKPLGSDLEIQPSNPFTSIAHHRPFLPPKDAPGVLTSSHHGDAYAWRRASTTAACEQLCGRPNQDTASGRECPPQFPDARTPKLSKVRGGFVCATSWRIETDAQDDRQRASRACEVCTVL